MKITSKEFNEQMREIRDRHSDARHDIFVKNGKVWTNTMYDLLDREREAEEAEIAELRKNYYSGVEVGDGVTVHLWSDSHAYTVIKRTAKTIIIRRDKAILDPNFKPEWIAGGFAGHCTNQDEQTYSYEPDENGEVLVIRWSGKRNCWTYLDKIVTMGRNEFYDYNF